MNIAQHLEASARRYPDRVAIHFEDSPILYRELLQIVGALSIALVHRGVGPGDRVALLLPNIPAFAFCYFAVLKIGAIAVSLNTKNSANETRFVLQDCSAKVLFTTAELLVNLPTTGIEHLQQTILAEGQVVGYTTLDDLLDNTSHSDSPIELDRHHPAVILYTSGTTGVPKGATLSHGNVISNAWSFVHNCGIQPQDRILVQLPLFHCFGQNALMNSAILAGATLILQRGFRPDTSLEAIQKQAVTMFFAVPTMFLALLDRASPKTMRSVRYFFSAAASLPEQVERRWQEKFGLPITQGYGLTETSPFACYNHFHQYRFGSVGTPIENVEMKIVDIQSGQPTPPGQPGEILIKGPNVMLGYWNRPTETAQAIREGWFHSGDIGTRDEDGYFYLTDRLKDMIDVGGMNVYPVEVENVLYQHEQVAEAAVYGIPDGLMGERVCAAIVLKGVSHVSPDELIQHCQNQLAGFKVPRTILLVEELPKNPSGKILKRVLRQQFPLDAQDHAHKITSLSLEYQAGDLQFRQEFLHRYLRERLAELLELQPLQIDLDEPITDLGLESLMAVDLGTRIRQELGIELTALSLVSGSTVRDISKILSSSRHEQGPG
jgi:long-chain acyl-CoA synthetase